MSQLAELTTITQKRFQCRHVHAAGRQCGSPALRNEEFCYFHHTTRSRKKTGGFRYLDATEPFELPLVEDRVSALSAAAQIFCRIASNDLDLGRAGKLLYNLQILNALLPREKALNTAGAPHLASEMWVPQNSAPQPLLEELVLDETHGLIAPIAELPPPNPADPLQNCHPERSSASAPNAVEGPAVASPTAPTPARTSPKPPKRVYTDEEKDFLKWTTSSTHYAPVHRPRPESITDDDIIAAINAKRRICSLGPIETDPNWNKATLSADPVDPSDPPFLSSAKPATLPALNAVACEERTTNNERSSAACTVLPTEESCRAPWAYRPRRSLLPRSARCP